MNPKLILASTALAASLALPLTVTSSEPRGDDASAAIERGRYLVTGFGCTDCHTPWVLGANGPEPDATRFLSGHPEDAALPPAPALEPGPWITTVSATNTAWSGPWGVSFTANLTPDVETGLGSWSGEDFLAAMRNGRHQGRGREILPPMPYPAIRTLSDADLLAVFAFLKSVPAIQNRVPTPLPPAAPQ